MSRLRQPSLESIQDESTRKAIQWIKDYIDQASILKGNFKFFTFTFNRAETELKIAHNLGFIPKDIITTYVSSGSVTWHYTKFDSTNLVLTTTGACTIRFFAGVYNQG